MDEATSALDTLTENSIQEALDRLGNHRTVLVIAHRCKWMERRKFHTDSVQISYSFFSLAAVGTIRNADNILVLKDGLVAEQGTHDELLEKDGIYAEMWNMQLHSSTGSQVGLDAFTE